MTKNTTKTKLVCKGFIDESPETQNALLDKMGRKRNKERTQMTKDQLLSLWNADNWEVMSCGVYFTAHRADADKELHINCNDYTEAEILAMPFWERLAQELDELDRQAHEILQKEFPDDEDIPGLALTDITIDKSGCYGTFSLCYDTGDSPAGELYLNVSFDEQFVPSPKVGYDTF